MGILAGFLGWFVAQLMKVIIYIITKTIKEKNFIDILFGSGGMPSSHSATVCAITTYICITDGLNSNLSALAIIFSFIVMYDAMNVRMETGRLGKYLNELRITLSNLVSDLPMEKKFKELVGHTPLQVLVGCLLGILVGIFVYYL